MPQPMMTVREAAEHFDVSDKTIRKWIKSGRLVAELRPGPTGKQYYVSDEVIDIAAEPGRLERVPSGSPSTLDHGTILTGQLPALLTELSKLTQSLEAVRSNPELPKLTAAVEALTARLDRLEQGAVPPAPAPPAAPHRHWWQFWRRTVRAQPSA